MNKDKQPPMFRFAMLNLRTPLSFLVVMTLLLGIAYPLSITGISQLLFPSMASGSLIEKDGKVVGSALLGQSFTTLHYFWGRPSATVPAYNAAASAGSNLAVSNPALAQQVELRIAEIKKAHPKNDASIPKDLITTSASGLDPHISPEAAIYQVSRVAAARKLPEKMVRDLVDQHTQGRLLGVLGQPRVNVLELNLALDDLQKKN